MLIAPLGQPLSESDTGRAKPPLGVTRTEPEAALPPRVTVSAGAVTENVEST